LAISSHTLILLVFHFNVLLFVLFTLNHVDSVEYLQLLILDGVHCRLFGFDFRSTWEFSRVLDS
jgi:hypothetical protein